MNDVSLRGGSRIGWVNTSYPLARLTCARERLVLKSLGSYEFTPDQVVSLAAFVGTVPILAQGIAIEHNRLDYPPRMVFWCMGNAEHAVERLRATGFEPRGQRVDRPGGMPLRWSFVIGVVLSWNLLLMGNLHRMMMGPMTSRLSFDAGMPTACALIFLLATGLKLSTRMQRIALAPGHTLGEVRPLLSLLQLVTLPLGIGFGAAWLLGGH